MSYLVSEVTEYSGTIDEQILYPMQLPKFDLNQMFKDQSWVPIKPEVTDKTSFIHAINLAVGGPLFPDV